MTVAKKFSTNNGANDKFKIVDLKNLKNNIVQNLYKLLQVGFTLPISSATHEHNFSST